MNEKYRIALSHFDQIARSETREWGDLQWHGEITNCDVCSRPMKGERYMIDGPASLQSDPPWGNLCVVCAFKYSPNVGWGKAQLYEKSSSDRWKLISGGPLRELADDDWP